MTLQQYAKMSKPALIRKITKALRAMPKAKLARLCYNITKSKLPRISIVKRTQQRGGAMARYTTLPREQITRKYPRGRIVRKFSRKQLAAQRLFAKRARAGTLRKRRR